MSKTIDKLIERDRYDERAHLIFSNGTLPDLFFGCRDMADYLKSPYLYYYQVITQMIRSEDSVLELAAGTGMHTAALLGTGATVTASDISPISLELLKARFADPNNTLVTKIADIEELPFSDNEFDVVVCAGGLSYGSPDLVDAQIRRVLRPGGIFICVDSLNHNPIYKFNRWIHYLRGGRTLSTLRRMPTLSRISKLTSGFTDVKVRYFGAFTFIMPVFQKLFGGDRAQVISDSLDRIVGAKRSAFKFVLIAQRLRLDQS
jgi:ubiquinone/menaquinone biosynthesis C-methylase UbiE